MTDINQLIASGRLVREPIIRRAESGTMIAIFTLASNHYYRTKGGAFEQQAAFIPCIAFSRSAELLAHRMKGEALVVVGRLRTDSWEQDSERRSQLTLVCDSVRCFSGGAANSVRPEAKDNAPDADEMPQEIKDSVPF